METSFCVKTNGAFNTETATARKNPSKHEAEHKNCTRFLSIWVCVIIAQFICGTRCFAGKDHFKQLVLGHWGYCCNANKCLA